MHGSHKWITTQFTMLMFYQVLDLYTPFFVECAKHVQTSFLCIYLYSNVTIKEHLYKIIYRYPQYIMTVFCIYNINLH